MQQHLMGRRFQPRAIIAPWTSRKTLCSLNHTCSTTIHHSPCGMILKARTISAAYISVHWTVRFCQWSQLSKLDPQGSQASCITNLQVDPVNLHLNTLIPLRLWRGSKPIPWDLVIFWKRGAQCLQAGWHSSACNHITLRHLDSDRGFKAIS